MSFARCLPHQLSRPLIGLLVDLISLCCLLLDLPYSWSTGEEGHRLRGTMPKNKGKGGKNRRRGKNENEETKRDLLFKEDGQGEV